MTAASKPKKPPMPRHGVDTPTLLATINAVGEQPTLAKFVFRADNSWASGTHSESAFAPFSGAGGEHRHTAEYGAASDHPKVLCGADRAPTPVEWLLHALASCLTAGIANVAAARGITLKRVESHVEGDMDLRGILGLDPAVRNGFENLRIRFEIEGDASKEELEKVIRQSQARSAVYDVMTAGVPISLSIA